MRPYLKVQRGKEENEEMDGEEKRRKEVERRKDREEEEGKREGRPSLSLKVLGVSFSFPSFSGDWYRGLVE